MITARAAGIVIEKDPGRTLEAPSSRPDLAHSPYLSE
jgi:hypothetical protein